MSMLSSIKSFFKRNVFFLKIYEFIFQRPIYNLYDRDFPKKMLFSYSTYHFKKKSYLSHSNYQESHIITEIFDELGYQVDVVNNNRLTKINLSKYQVIFGEGLPLFQALSASPRPLTIYYGTGSHPFHCTEQSYKRLISFFHQYDFLALSSMRTNDSRWGVAASLSDALICIGNSNTQETFLERGVKHVLPIDPTFHQRSDALSLGQQKDFSHCRKSMLWFGSYGLLHKGLDLAVEGFRTHPDWTLHVCGYTPNEKEYLSALNLPSNVVVHGFIDVFSDSFSKLASQCGFVILPSCSEGTATAVVTAVGNGAMIPVVTKECGYDVDQAGFIIELSAADIERQLEVLDKLDASSLKQMANKAQLAAITRYTKENYSQKMARYLRQITDSERG